MWRHKAVVEPGVLEHPVTLLVVAGEAAVRAVFVALHGDCFWQLSLRSPHHSVGSALMDS
jgi:hypothetical protein